MMTAGTFGVRVVCKEAPLGYELLQGQEGLLSNLPLPDTRFCFSHSDDSVTITNASEWKFEKVVTSGYFQHQDVFPWGQRVRCKVAPPLSVSPVSVEGTLQMPPGGAPPDVFAVFFSDANRHWAVGPTGWMFEKVIADPITSNADCADHIRSLIGKTVRIVRAPGDRAVVGQQATVRAPHLSLVDCLVTLLFSGNHAVHIHPSASQQWSFEEVTLVAKTFDEVQRPKHYNSSPSGVECIEIMERLGANLGSAFKYLWRADDKHETPTTDLKKALWYLRRELAFEWEPSTTTEARLKRVVPHETFAVGSAMWATFDAAWNGSSEKRAVIEKAIGFVEMELQRLEKA